jgi:hypothetical protein
MVLHGIRETERAQSASLLHHVWLMLSRSFKHKGYIGGALPYLAAEARSNLAEQELVEEGRRLQEKSYFAWANDPDRGAFQRQ